MANYLANYRKKLDMLSRKRRDLIRLLERHGAEQDVVMAAEEVREAQVRALAAKRAQIPSCERNVAQLQRVDEEISSCLHLSVADIISSFRNGEKPG